MTARAQALSLALMCFAACADTPKDACAGAPEPQILFTNPKGGNRIIFGLVPDGDVVYWPDGWAGSIVRLPKIGGLADMLVTGQSNPHHLVVDDTTLYWISGDQTVRSQSKTGGTVADLFVGPECTQQTGCNTELVGDTEALYFWSEQNRHLVRIAKNGSGVIELATIGVPAIAVDSDFVYWTDLVPNPALIPLDLRLYRAPKTGGQSEVWADLGDALPSRTITSSQYVFVSALDRASGNGQIYIVTKAGAEVTLVATAGTAAIGADDSYVYHSQGSSLLRRSLADGTTTTLACSRGEIPSQQTIANIAIDDTRAYWTDSMTLMAIER